LIANCKTEELAPNDSKHSLTSVLKLDAISVIPGRSEKKRALARERERPSYVGVIAMLRDASTQAVCVWIAVL
jgi:hypothetical protein